MSVLQDSERENYFLKPDCPENYQVLKRIVGFQRCWFGILTLAQLNSIRIAMAGTICKTRNS